MNDIRIRTARLTLVPSSLRWRGELSALFNDPDVADWLFLAGPHTREQLDRRIEIALATTRAATSIERCCGERRCAHTFAVIAAVTRARARLAIGSEC